ncbi:MAG: sulfite oxidase-like oxidoreductase [Candidatus Asgardarchaeia archaeon]
MINKNRLPPGQKLVPKEKFPILHYAAIPKVSIENFVLNIYGHVEKEISLTWNELMKLPKVKIKADFHCVTGWSVFDLEWEGIPFIEIHKLAKPKNGAKFVMFRSLDGYKTNVPLELLLRDNVIFAYKLGDKQLPPEHGGPLRIIIPHLYGWKSAKWVNSIEYMTKNKMGFWESRGYHPIGDPWREERYR